MRRLATAVCALALLLAACGEQDERPSAPAEPAADLTVTVRPDGEQGPARRRRVRCDRLGSDAAQPLCRRLGALTPARLAPVPPETACTGIYGGPAVARVRGRLLGERVDARFDRTNGCEINRWERNRALLGG